MALIMRISKAALMAAIVAATGACALGAAAAQDAPPSDDRDSPANVTAFELPRAAQDVSSVRASVAAGTQDRDSIAKNGIVFRSGSSKTLAALGLRQLSAELAEAPKGVAEKTKVFVASADVASLPGPEAVAFVKGPVNCGSLGCTLVIVGLKGGTKVTLLDTLGVTIDSPAMDKIIVNKGTDYEVVWTFNGEQFVEE